MRSNRRRLRAALVPAALLAASPSLTARQAIPIRQVESPTAATTEPLGNLLGVSELKDGRLLIDDGGRKRLLLFDAALASFTVISDTLPGAKYPYGDSPAPIIPFTGDSILFLTWPARAFFVIDPNGAIVRTAALPKSGDMGLVAGSRSIVDPLGRLWYRARAVLPRIALPPAGAYTTQAPDSSGLVRADFETRTIDTVAYVRTPIQPRVLHQPIVNSQVPPEHVLLPTLSIVDDWTVMSDGTVAIVRGHDYHIDWLGAGGTVSSTPKMPFDWRRVTDDEKQKMADSVVAEWQKRLDDARAREAAHPPPARALPPGAISMSMIAMGNIADGATIGMTTHATVAALPLSEMPDFYPAIRAGAARSDLDNNLWILPSTSARSASGGIVYDVVNRKGELFERVEMPPERSLAGFGPRGTIYMMWRDSASTWHVERTRVKR